MATAPASASDAVQDGVDKDAAKDGATQAAAATPAEHASAAEALIGVATKAVDVGLGQLRCLGREGVGLLGVRQGGNGVVAGDGQCVVQVALGLRQPGAGPGAHAATAGGDVVRRRTDLGLCRHDGLL